MRDRSLRGNRPKLLWLCVFVLAGIAAGVCWWILANGGLGEFFLISGLTLAAMGLGIELAARLSRAVGGTPATVQFSASACTIFGALLTAGGTAETLRVETDGKQSARLDWFVNVGCLVGVAVIVTAIAFLALTHARGRSSGPETQQAGPGRSEPKPNAQGADGAQRRAWHPTAEGRLFFVESVLMGLLILGPSVAVALALDFQHGNLAEWLSALATTGALIAALAAARYAKKAFELERSRDNVRDEERREQQASQVAAWVQRLQLAKKQSSNGPVKVLVPPGQVFNFINRSGLPVTDAVFVFQARVQRNTTFILSLGEWRHILLTPNDLPQELPLPEPVRAALQRVATDNVDRKTGEVPAITVTVGVTFTDTANRHWTRQPNGSLAPAADAVVTQRLKDASL